MAEPTPITFCLLVPSGAWNIDALATSIRAHHPDAALVAVWCGDPHRRPTLPAGIRWCDLALSEPTGAGWGLLQIALDPRSFEWSRTGTAVADLLDSGYSEIIVMKVGSVAVLGDAGGVVEAGSDVTVVLRCRAEPAADGLAPSHDDLLRAGRYSTSVLGLGAGASGAMRALGRRMAMSTGPAGPVFEQWAARWSAAECIDARVTVAGWCESIPSHVAVIDLDDLDREEPWHFSFGRTPARTRLSTNPVLGDAVARSLDQIAGAPSPVMLPGGIAVDAAMAEVVCTALSSWRLGAEARPPAPFGASNSAFVRWLETPDPGGTHLGRYWMATHRVRPDLQAAFPKPHSTDASRYGEWIAASARLEPGRSGLWFPPGGSDHSISSLGFDRTGLNVLGYLDFDQSQGHIARRLIEAFTEAEVPVSAINHHRSLGSARSSSLDTDRGARYATNLVVVNADQFEFVVADHERALLADRRTIAYWFWELEHVPARFQEAIASVDEIWTGSQFVADAFAAVTSKPVTSVPLPIVEPQPSKRDRSTMGVADDSYLFLVTFDQFSVPERKNPFGVIDAFTRAFRDAEGPTLLIKTMNGSRGWRNHERLLLATRGRDDIVVWDEHLDRADQMAVLAAADCLVSLHRSEGLGLHCGEAMWLGKPVIATAYSGNLDFMDSEVAAMIDYTMVPVRHGEGIYPPEAHWAEPDVDQAATWMRRLADDPGLGVRLGDRARARMQQQPSMAATGRHMAQLAGLETTTGETS